MPDPQFADPRLAVLYDVLDHDRSDLEPYLDLAREVQAHRVLDIGCGTGSLAVLLAARGHDVVAVDPAAASIDVARQKPGAHQVRWLIGDATDLPGLAVDLAVMTGNVAQVFVEDDAWAATLAGTRRALRPGGRLVLESRDPAHRAWLGWTRERSYRETALPGSGSVASWVEVLGVQGGWSGSAGRTSSRGTAASSRPTRPCGSAPGRPSPPGSSLPASASTRCAEHRTGRVRSWSSWPVRTTGPRTGPTTKVGKGSAEGRDRTVARNRGPGLRHEGGARRGGAAGQDPTGPREAPRAARRSGRAPRRAAHCRAAARDDAGPGGRGRPRPDGRGA